MAKNHQQSPKPRKLPWCNGQHQIDHGSMAVATQSMRKQRRETDWLTYAGVEEEAAIGDAEEAGRGSCVDVSWAAKGSSHSLTSSSTTR